MTSVVRMTLEVRSRATRCVDFTLELHLMYGSGAFLVHPGANLVSDLQIFAASYQSFV